MADPLACETARRAIARGFDQKTALPARIFFYLPFEHSENLADQERSVALFRSTGDAELIRWAELHADIIRRFGRFPRRNAALGRATTPEEQAFLDSWCGSTSPRSAPRGRSQQHLDIVPELRGVGSTVSRPVLLSQLMGEGGPFLPSAAAWQRTGATGEKCP